MGRPQIAVPLLWVGDGNRASAHLTPGSEGWRGGAARCGARGFHPLNRQPGRTTSHQHAQGCGGGARLKYRDSRQTTLAMRGQRPQKPPASDSDRHPAMRAGQTSRICFLYRPLLTWSGLVQQPDRSRLRAIYPFSLDRSLFRCSGSGPLGHLALLRRRLRLRLL